MAAVLLDDRSLRSPLTSARARGSSRTKTRSSSRISRTRQGNPVFDETLRQGLTIELEQSPFLRLMSEARIRRTLRLMRRSADAPLTPELAREVCERNGGTASVEGSVASLGREYVLGLRAKNCATGDVLYDKQVQVRRKEDVLNALTQIARAFRSRAGESLASVRRHDTPLIEATTPSLEALKAYSASIKVGYRGGGCAASVPFGRRAIELDPQFAMAHSHLGRCYSNLGESELAAESATKAYELRDRASDREKFYIVLNYDRQVLGNLVKAQEAGELWIQTYPRDAVSIRVFVWAYLPRPREIQRIDRGSPKGDRPRSGHGAIIRGSRLRQRLSGPHRRGRGRDSPRLGA